MSEENQDVHICKVFRNDDDVDAMREFTRWLKDGGMQSLRDCKTLSDDYQKIRSCGISAFVKSLANVIGFLIGAGILFLIGKISYNVVLQKALEAGK